MKWPTIALIACFSNACLSDVRTNAAVESSLIRGVDSIPQHIIPSGKTVEARFPVPEGYVRMPADSVTFGAYLHALPLHPHGHEVRLYDGGIKPAGEVYCAVLDLDVGTGDLQQCADAVIRLRAEYLYRQKRYSDIHFRFTNGFVAEYARWRRGERIRVKGNRAWWVSDAAASDAYPVFRQYLDVVFMYAGTASLERELVAAEPATLLPGDVWIKGGHPGHAVIVLDVAVKAESGARLFLLAQSYMPAQEIQVLLNPVNAGLDPWYSTDEIGENLETPEWTFGKDQLRRFQ